MKLKLTPAELRAEAFRDLVLRLKGAATTEELVEAAEAIGGQAKKVIKGNNIFLEKCRTDPEKKG